MKSVDGFQISEVVKKAVAEMASFVEAGRKTEAVEVGLEAFEAGRNILAAFLRHSVIDRAETQDQPEKLSFFTQVIGLRRDKEKYDEDIVAGLESKCKKLEEAIRAETNSCFTQRVEAYNVVKRALVSADQEQRRRDRVRSQQTFKNGPGKKQQDTEATTARNQAAAANQRQQLLEKRKKDADDIRSLL